ncbi:MAG: hypothetical protein CR982_05845 [Candidatus Cloacimonadota bacterium]|nr:MAG: hypothetical protein CR982_05845 [Candidatus Cloacimonadota bacterium]PIE81642.1 MAG: hypothetical protein CSA15_00530 [Candidatus Delongbacteria bacterium]
MKLNNYTIISIVIRSMFIKLFYNYKTLYGQGLCFCLLPSRKNLKTEIQLFFERHSDFFNTNDHLSGFAIGTIIKLEEEGKYHLIAKIKKIYSTSLGAIGDNLIHKTIKPIAVLIPVNIALFFNLKTNYIFYTSIALIITLLIFFNIYIRIFGIISGYKNGISSIKMFKENFLAKFTKYCNYIIYILIGLSLINLMKLIPNNEGYSIYPPLMIFLIFFIYMFQKLTSYIKLSIIVIVISIMISLFSKY